MGGFAGREVSRLRRSERGEEEKKERHIDLGGARRGRVDPNDSGGVKRGGGDRGWGRSLIRRVSCGH